MKCFASYGSVIKEFEHDSVFCCTRMLLVLFKESKWLHKENKTNVINVYVNAIALICIIASSHSCRETESQHSLQG